jgi:hypothetical protein
MKSTSCCIATDICRLSLMWEVPTSSFSPGSIKHIALLIVAQAATVVYSLEQSYAWPPPSLNLLYFSNSLSPTAPPPPFKLCLSEAFVTYSERHRFALSLTAVIRFPPRCLQTPRHRHYLLQCVRNIILSFTGASACTYSFMYLTYLCCIYS